MLFIYQVTVYKCDLTNFLLFQTKHSVLYKETRRAQLACSNSNPLTLSC